MRGRAPIPRRSTRHQRPAAAQSLNSWSRCRSPTPVPPAEPFPARGVPPPAALSLGLVHKLLNDLLRRLAPLGSKRRHLTDEPQHLDLSAPPLIPRSCYNAPVMSLTSFLFRLARLSADTRALGSASPKKMARRGKNKALGRLLGRGGLWRRLWR
jgi:hypothetical protein